MWKKKAVGDTCSQCGVYYVPKQCHNTMAVCSNACGWQGLGGRPVQSVSLAAKSQRSSRYALSCCLSLQGHLSLQVGEWVETFRRS